MFVRGTLEGMALAAELYAKHNNGEYPASMSHLIEAVPPYITINHCGTVEEGYVFTCTMDVNGYTFTATPINNPSTTWVVVTGIELSKME